jgi:hypothetical protein
LNVEAALNWNTNDHLLWGGATKLKAFKMDEMHLKTKEDLRFIAAMCERAESLEVFRICKCRKRKNFMIV